jgi:gamma-glutamyltranspeptidase/glutathione hydrolase
MTSGGVVVAVEALAATAGASMLERGGNAADAAVAAAFAQGVVNPMACGIAGSLHGLFYEARTGAVTAVDASGYAPGAAHERLWQPAGNWMTQYRVVGEGNRWGWQAATVPGFVRGVDECLRRFGSGRVTWAEVIAPAIGLAGDGFVVYPHLYKEWMPNQYSNGFLGDGPKTLGFTDAGARIFLRDGQVPRIGELLVQHDYASTLRRIADQGPDEFYEGETARAMADDFARNGGLITMEDLRGFRPLVQEPLTSTYRGLRLACETAPTLGPAMVQMLNVIEGWDLAALGWNTPEYLDRLARAMHLAFRERAERNGDPDLVDVPVERLVSKEHAAELRELIESGRDTEGRQATGARAVPGHTTHVTVVDNAGNAAAITHSIGSASGALTPGLGFLHNNHMIMFDPNPGRPNSVGPRKRPANGGDPLFVFDGDELVLAIGSPAGGRKATAIVQILLDVFDFGMPVQEAVAAVRIHSEDQPDTIIVEPSFPSELALQLAARGFAIEIDPYTARVAAVRRDPATGRLDPGADPRCDAGAAVV